MDLETTNVSHQDGDENSKVLSGSPELAGASGLTELPSETDSVRFRCPHCQKLYRTSLDVFEGSQPEFECASCSKSFGLTTEMNAFGLYQTLDNGHTLFVKCPKCTHLKAQNADECPSCGVFASKYEELQKVESPSLFELNQIWQKAVADFNRDELHQEFISCCQRKMALSFAFKKYSDLQKTIGFDSACEKYMNQIELRLEQQFRHPTSAEKLEEKKQILSAQVLFIAMGFLGMALLLYNRIKPTFPNLTGLVVAITVLSFGLGIVSSQRKSGGRFKL